MKISIDAINIRTYLLPGDIGRVIYLHGDIYGKEYNFEQGFEFYVAREVGNLILSNFDKHRFWVAEHQNKVIGFISLMDRGLDVQLRFFIIEKQYRGIGLGKKLMNLCLQALEKSNYSTCYLWTTDLLPTAIGLYESCGFKLIEERIAGSFGSPLRELKYELTLR